MGYFVVLVLGVGIGIVIMAVFSVNKRQGDK